ncbi:hypothetical protein RRG08_057068 [Elysia crispata]|uniref:Uncharacterized protein n=1 Tax=Elysia crispata TaxID=231223 RepID=A0AAE1ALP5_9GAST|nr:hypothetical protein RRG08_057068 [Elysia crispata]
MPTLTRTRRSVLFSRAAAAVVELESLTKITGPFTRTSTSLTRQTRGQTADCCSRAHGNLELVAIFRKSAASSAVMGGAYLPRANQ